MNYVEFMNNIFNNKYGIPGYNELIIVSFCRKEIFIVYDILPPTVAFNAFLYIIYIM